MAELGRAHLKELGHAPPYRVLALSLGAMVAVAWGRLYPAEIEKMVLINTSLAAYSPFYHRLRPKNYASLLLFLLYGSAAGREKLILRLTSNACRQAILEKWTAYAREYPITRANILRQLYAALSYRAQATRPAAHTLLLAAQKDQLVNVKCSLAIAQHWHCDIRLHATAGHDLPLDDPVWVAQQVSEWLDDPAIARIMSAKVA